MFHHNTEFIDALVEAKQYKPIVVEDQVIELPNRPNGWRGALSNLFESTRITQA